GGAQLLAGTYYAEGFDVEWQHSQLREALRARVGKGPYTLRGMLYIISGGGCLGLIIAILFAATASLMGYAGVPVLICVAFSLLIIFSSILRRLPIVP